MCRLPSSGWPGSPASPARPAPHWCSSDKAALFVDGRYTLQAAEQADKSVFAIEHLVERTPEDWIADHLPAGGALGYDPWRTSLDGAERLAKACARAKGKLVAVADNPLDAVWSRPPGAAAGARGAARPEIRRRKRRGRSSRASARSSRSRSCDAAVLSDLASVAWTFNIRGGDVAHTPVALSWAIVPRTGTPLLFVDSRKLSNQVRDALAKARGAARARPGRPAHQARARENHPARSGHRPAPAGRRDRKGRRHREQRRRPGHPHEGGQERRRDRRRPRRARARRRGAHALSRLARP